MTIGQKLDELVALVKGMDGNQAGLLLGLLIARYVELFGVATARADLIELLGDEARPEPARRPC